MDYLQRLHFFESTRVWFDLVIKYFPNNLVTIIQGTCMIDIKLTILASPLLYIIHLKQTCNKNSYLKVLYMNRLAIVFIQPIEVYLFAILMTVYNKSRNMANCRYKRRVAPEN